MERDGLLHVAGDRHLQLTDDGRHQATAVMRKHRLAERLLADVIGLDWEDVHIEACRWEHVMSDAVERRIVALLDKPLVCPHGNPIPGLADLGLPSATSDDPSQLVSLTDAAGRAGVVVVVDRISEQIQPDQAVMREVTAAGLRPGARVLVTAAADGVATGVQVSPDAVAGMGGAPVTVARRVSDHIFVRAVATAAARAVGATGAQRSLG
jgi:DtxR family Mn-dependent transcriptional regulator